ncbi:TetR/AcrR family transcriptional regulator [Occultella aeris]|uniref:Putative DNA-binding transcriptional regulator n=1 Tax=Occultella aeris TaxID=2761496 RepID=A0A7M4DEZ7_9MICO|nr:TetR/AcrR family transcriptional regulator [Occultella aeris]VZO35490.1 putative DNA-binding transcriptional regulator [Occultella aeris]
MREVSIPVMEPSPAQVRLMESAERLVALRGFDGASSRAITQAAGHRNHSAINYYFGSRQGLLDSIYHWRSTPISAHRGAMVADLVAHGRETDPEALMRAFVEPYATALDALRPSFWARYSVASLANRPLIFMGEVRRDVKRFNDIEVPLSVTLDLFDMMRAVACGGREPDAGLRVAVIVRSINATMAAWEADVERRDLDTVPLEVLAEQAVRLGSVTLTS